MVRNFDTLLLLAIICLQSTLGSVRLAVAATHGIVPCPTSIIATFGALYRVGHSLG